MKVSIVKNILMGVSAFAVLSLQNCRKETFSPGSLEKPDSSLAVPTVLAATSSYVVSTLVDRNSVANFVYPFYICSDADGLLYVTLPTVNAIYKVSLNGATVKYLSYNSPYGIKAGANGSLYFISNYLSPDGSIDTSAVVKVEKNKKITVLPLAEKLSQILDLAIAPDSSIYIPDYLNNRIIKFTKQGVTSVLAGKKGVNGYVDGQGENAHFTYPTYVKFGEDGNLWVVDGAVFNPGQSIRKISMAGNVTTLYRLKPDYKNHSYIESFAITKRDKNFNLSPYENVFFFVRSFPGGSGVASNQLFHLSYNKVLTPITGNLPEDYNYMDGPAMQANFNVPTAITVNSYGLFIADQVNNVIRKITRQ